MNKQYFDWLVSFTGSVNETELYSKLLTHLHNRYFDFLLNEDDCRNADGIRLRTTFAELTGIYIYDLRRDRATILELMVALSIRMEDTMFDPSFGDRTGLWFWGMIQSLGLLYMSDSQYDEESIDETIDCFITRKYLPNGHGGLFTLDHEQVDLRRIGIWTQSCWYLDSLLF